MNALARRLHRAADLLNRLGWWLAGGRQAKKRKRAAIDKMVGEHAELLYDLRRRVDALERFEQERLR